MTTSYHVPNLNILLAVLFTHLRVTVTNFSLMLLITEIMASDSTFASMFTGNWENPQSIEKELEYEPLSKRLMTIWTNFAKTGYGLY